MKKLVAIILSLVMLFACAAMAEGDTQTIQIGTSGLEFFAPDTYVAGDITSEDTDESQVGYYASEDSLVDFDLYQWAKAEGETLADVAAAEAAEFGATAESKTYGGITVYCYNAEEDYDGTTYQTVTCLMENGGYVLELVFWLDGEGAQEIVDGFMATLSK